MKFIFFGTPEVAKSTLAALQRSGFLPQAIVTNPDAPRGRGHIMSSSPVKLWAVENNLPVLTPDRLDQNFINDLSSFGADYAIVVAYGKILPEALINSFPKGVLNVHYSLLPFYRGAAPLEAALLNGETETGVTIQKMVRVLDAGDIVASKAVKITRDDTALTLRPRLIEAGAELLIASLPGYLSGTAKLKAQDHAAATYAPKLSKNDGELKLNDPDAINWNKYRAFLSGIGTYFFTNGRRIKITAAHRSAEGRFVIDRVTPESGKDMPYQDFIKHSP